MGKRVGVFLIRCYQRGFAWMPPTCRFHPCCSQYALEAVERFGLLRGAWLAAKRLAKCHPFHPGGSDPVPTLTEYQNSRRKTAPHRPA